MYHEILFIGFISTICISGLLGIFCIFEQVLQMTSKNIQRHGIERAERMKRKQMERAKQERVEQEQDQIKNDHVKEIQVEREPLLPKENNHTINIIEEHF